MTSTQEHTYIPHTGIVLVDVYHYSENIKDDEDTLDASEYTVEHFNVAEHHIDSINTASSTVTLSLFLESDIPYSDINEFIENLNISYKGDSNNIHLSPNPFNEPCPI